jgi:hypothetical protein
MKMTDVKTDQDWTYRIATRAKRWDGLLKQLRKIYNTLKAYEHFTEKHVYYISANINVRALSEFQEQAIKVAVYIAEGNQGHYYRELTKVETVRCRRLCSLLFRYCHGSAEFLNIAVSKMSCTTIFDFGRLTKQPLSKEQVAWLAKKVVDEIEDSTKKSRTYSGSDYNTLRAEATKNLLSQCHQIRNEHVAQVITSVCVRYLNLGDLSKVWKAVS